MKGRKHLIMALLFFHWADYQSFKLAKKLRNVRKIASCKIYSVEPLLLKQYYFGRYFS